LIGCYFRSAPAVRPVSRFAFVVPTPLENSTVWVVGGFPLSDFSDVAIAPDGTEIAYVGSAGNTTEVFLRRMDRQELTPLAGTQGAFSPFFSPDGQWVGFFRRRQVKESFYSRRRTCGAV